MRAAPTTFMARSRHRFGDHTGEVEMTVEADSVPVLFEEAARGLAGLLADDSTGPATQPDERVALSSTDREALLVEFLNELLYRGEVNKCVYGDVRVEHVDDRTLEATIRGREPRAPRTAVKAATWHGVRIRPLEGGVEATVVLDV
jgi:SHS2 domain-containing protein